VLAITGQSADLAEFSIREARQVALNARRTLARRGAPGSGRTNTAMGEIDRVTGLLEQIVAQARMRVAGGLLDGGDPGGVAARR
jgi:hypothetical protein